jgi:hypothetical protein
VIPTPFEIGYSFNMDGTAAEGFTIPLADLSGTLSGSNKKFTIGTMIKMSDNTTHHFFGNWTDSMQCRILSSGEINWVTKFGGVAKTVQSTEKYTSTTEWYFILLMYDYSQPLGSRATMSVNDSMSTIAVDGYDTVLDTPIADYYLTCRNDGVLCLTGLQNMSFFIDDVPTSEQITELYNSGMPINPQSIFPSAKVLNPDESGMTEQFTMTDPVNGITATSYGLEEEDKVCENPYGITNCGLVGIFDNTFDNTFN